MRPFFIFVPAIFFIGCTNNLNDDIVFVDKHACNLKHTALLKSATPENKWCYLDLSTSRKCVASDSQEFSSMMISLPKNGVCDVNENWTKEWIRSDINAFGGSAEILGKFFSALRSKNFKQSLGELRPEAKAAFELEGIVSATQVSWSRQGSIQQWAIPIDMQSCSCSLLMNFFLHDDGNSSLTISEMVVD